MRRNTVLLAFTIVLVGLGTMGSECPTDIGGTDGGAGTDGGTETDGGASACLDTGTCDPNKYPDSSQGDYATSNYPLLFLDTTGNGVPDTATNKDGEIVLIDGYAQDSAIEYWLLSPVNASGQLQNIFPSGATFVNRIYVPIDRATGQKVGNAIVDTAPDSSNYSPIMQVFNVLVPSDYVADTIKSEATLLQAVDDADNTGITVEPQNKLFVIQMVDQSVTLAGGGGANDPTLEEAWFNGFKIYGYSIPGGNSDGSLPVANQSSDPGQTPPDPYLSELFQFRTSSAACFGHNVYLDDFGGPLYSPIPVLHYYEVPACADVPTNADDVITNINDGAYTQTNSDITVVIGRAHV